MGETCREKLKVNEPLHFPQNNWIVTQFVNKSIPAVYNVNPTTVFIYIDYYLDTSCEPVDCYPNFQLLYRLVNQSDPTVATDTNGYTLLANVTSYDDTSLHSRTYNFSISPSDNGFYIGIRDIGANITITRLFVYRLIGPQGQINLTLYPEVPAPSTGHIHVSGTCVANANTTSGYPPVLRLESTGEWRDGDQCYCIEGHQPELIEGSTQCQGKSTLGITIMFR
jgi:ephrin-B